MQIVFLDGFQDDSHHAIDIVHHIAIPEAENAVAVPFKIGSALSIIFFLIDVLAAIQFDDEFLTRSTEIGDVRANGVLAAEMNAIRPVGAQKDPKFGFCFGHLLAELLGTMEGYGSGSSVGHSTPLPSPHSKSRNGGRLLLALGIVFMWVCMNMLAVVDQVLTLPNPKAEKGEMCAPIW
jgi:hypothetical protein